MNSPFFSITIPAYNRGYILPETIKSIQEQTFQAWEVIIVDDGSKDNTREIVEQLSAEDSRIRYVYQDNAERSAARNNGADTQKECTLCSSTAMTNTLQGTWKKWRHLFRRNTSLLRCFLAI